MRQNLQIYGRYFGLPRALVRAKAAELLEFVQLTERADEPVEPLSGGMKRRLTIARALINDPELLLLDEPTTGLDPQARHLLWDRLYRLKREGVTLIITTHYMDEAEQLCDRLVVMDGGLIVAEGSPAELIDRYSTREVLELRFAPERRPAGRGAGPVRRAGRGAAGPVAALHRRRRAARRPSWPRPASARCPRWSAARRWRTCSCGSPAGRWWTDGRPTDIAVPPRAAGARRRSAGVLRIVEHYWIWYRRNWRATAVLLGAAAAAVPAGLRGRASARWWTAPAGSPRPPAGSAYLVWLAPALLAVSAVQSATFESTYPVLSGFKWQRVYHAMTAAPISPAQVAVAHLSWVSAKIGRLRTDLRRWSSPGSAGSPGRASWCRCSPSVLTGAAVAALVTAYSARLETEGGAFSVLFRLVLIPMTLFSGTFFPIDRLPGWIAAAGLGLAAVARHRAGPRGRARPLGAARPRSGTWPTCWSCWLAAAVTGPAPCAGLPMPGRPYR